MMIERIVDGRTDLIFEHLEAGGPPDATDASGVSLMQWCAYYGDVSAMRELLKAGETLESLGPNFDLNGAAFHGHWPLCQFLLERGADANGRLPESGETPLHSAMSKTNRPPYNLVAEVLIAAGADPNCKTTPGKETGSFMRDCLTKGETPLHRAAAFGDEAAIRLLLDAGAEIEARDANGETPLSWASWYGRPAYILGLLCYGPHHVHPLAIQQSRRDPRMGWTSGMAVNLLGRPHV